MKKSFEHILKIKNLSINSKIVSYLYSVKNRFERFFQASGFAGGYDSSWDVFERKADVHINSLYINIWGALDNIAWVFAYESNYIGEAGTKNYGEITFEQNKGLFKHLKKESTQFLEKIKTINFFKWLSELSKIRHPSAHRIPFYNPRIITEFEDEKMKAIYKEKNEIHSKLLKEFNTTDDSEKNKMCNEAIRKLEVLNNQEEKLGKQSNVFIGSDGIQFGFETIVADVRKLNEFLEISLSELKK